jgi:3-hydroxyacyl-CoA dehydrogenase/enoyl-CoA hydratase/3-hydroxybutyryl-CoA epimerase/3-hydroxyacyl-CoA dehydrogenase/enoyl-CoA hydratase/3-hydroxybutyryl-CoA epimerase/enoyl-CoA isomerase
MAGASTITLSFPSADIAVLTFDAPGKRANVLSRSVLDELSRHLDQLEERSDLAGLVIRSAKPGVFIAGADVTEFMEWIDAGPEDVQASCRRGQQLFARLSACPFVTVAAIDGVCLGGGAEVAVWCDRRIMTDDAKTQIGFPEVKLGIYPGWGGTARTPRMIGLSNAVELVTSGESIDAAKAVKLGLIEDVVSRDALERAAAAMIRAERDSGRYLNDRERWAQPLMMSETELAFLGATASTYIHQQTHGNYPAPLAALNVMLEASGLTLDEACVKEAEGIVELFGSPVNRSLLNVFFLQDRNKKDPGVDRPGLETRPIRSVAVIGAGIMGQGIAAANVRRQLDVTITDAAQEALGTGFGKILEEVAYDKTLKGPDPKRMAGLAPLLHPTHAESDLARCDLVIEAIVEKFDVKKDLFARLESKLAAETLLASNTSTIPISRLAAGLAHPHRFCGIHFFNPVRRMPLVEVIRGEKTSDETIATAVAYAKSIGKSPIVVSDGPGFLVNRLLLPYMNEALELLLEGSSMQSVDRAATSFGMPMGPIQLYDVVGLDTALHAGRVMYEAFPDRVVASELLAAMFKAGHLGQKSGAGFFLHKGGKGRREANPAALRLIEERRRAEASLTAEQITERLFLPMVIEATRVLEDRIARNVRDVDLGLIYGIGFPPFRGGLLFWADTLGAKKIVEMLKPYNALGKRYAPTEMLLEMARSGRKFYGDESK